MPENLTIAASPPADVALHYDALRTQGMASIEQSAAAQWTDYNVHDPGITLLELLCYALTDLAYRAEYPLADLLADADNNPQTIIGHFLTAKQILPNQPVTPTDYRKLLIDIEGVKNAWLQQQQVVLYADMQEKKLLPKPPLANPFQTVLVKGFYNVLLEYDLQVKTDAEKEAVKTLVKQKLAANRNLCEDFLAIDEVQQQSFRLCAEIELSPLADVNETLARILLKIQLLLTPFVRFYSLGEMLDSGIPVAEVFEGPLLENGFIKTSELEAANLPAELHLSDIMQQVLGVNGVVNINELLFQDAATSSVPENPWIIPVRSGHQPQVLVSGSRVLFYKNGMPIRPDMVRVQQRFQELYDEVFSSNEAKTTEDYAFPLGRYRDVASYTSLLHHLPRNYGVGPWGLPPDATIQRRAQAKQWQAYLWIFDELLASGHAQIAHLRNLFSLEEEKTTIFTQLVSDVAGVAELFISPATIASDIQEAAEPAPAFQKRRHAFLNHLLARYAETFQDYMAVVDAVFPAANPMEAIKAKTDFLKNYEAYSSGRFAAYNYEDASRLWDTDNNSGLEQRVQKLLGIADTRRRSLVRLVAETIAVVQEDGTTHHGFEVKAFADNTILLQHAEALGSGELAAAALSDLVDRAQQPGGIQVQAVDGGFVVQVKKGAALLAQSPGVLPTEAAAMALQQQLTDLLQAPAFEGMLLFEHPLLLPEIGAAYLPICVDQDCAECADLDPYSFRISVVLPALAPRFRQMDFRRYAERLIRTETPAHLFPKICWIDNAQLLALEQAYRPWLEVKAGSREDADGAILQTLVDVLTTLKTVYPVTTLQECAAGEDRNLFLLNQHSLGTLKP